MPASRGEEMRLLRAMMMMVKDSISVTGLFPFTGIVGVRGVDGLRGETLPEGGLDFGLPSKTRILD